MPGGILNRLFGGESKKTPKAQSEKGAWTAATAVANRQPLHMGGHRAQPEAGLQPPGQPQMGGLLLGPSLGGGKIGDKELMTREKLLQRTAFRGAAAAIPEAQVLINLVGNYQQIIDANRIPAGDSPNFIKEMGAVNGRIMSAHEELIAKFAESSQALRDRAMAGQMPEAVLSGVLADDCANLAMITQAQKIYLNKIYDDMITAKQKNPGALTEVSGKTYGEILSNLAMYHFSEASAQALGAGGINTVYRDRFQGEDRVFKRGKTYEHSQIDPVTGIEKNVGLQVMEDRMDYRTEELRYGDQSAGRVIKADTAPRDVAYSRLNKLFGFDIAVNTQLAKSGEGETSSLMDMGQGETADKFLFYAGAEWSGEAGDWAQREHTDESAKAQKRLNALRQNLHMLNVEKWAGMVNETDYENKKAEIQKQMQESEKWLAKLKKMGTFQTVDLADPKVALQLFKLSVLDLVAGHVDRHAGNYMINKTEEGETKITAIDNDTSFGTRTDIESDKDVRGGEVRPALEEAFPFIPPEIKEKVMAVSRENIEQALTGLLSKPQIEAACIRLAKVQASFQKLEEKHRVEEVSRANMSELFGKSRFSSYHAGLYQSRSMNSEEWFKKKHPNGAPAKPLPSPPQAGASK
jgi:hypothetical protein